MIFYYRIRKPSTPPPSGDALRTFLNANATAQNISNGYNVTPPWPYPPMFASVMSTKLTDTIIGSYRVNTYAVPNSSYTGYFYDTSDETFFELTMPGVINTSQYLAASPLFYNDILYTFVTVSRPEVQGRPNLVMSNPLNDFSNTTYTTGDTAIDHTITYGAYAVEDKYYVMDRNASFFQIDLSGNSTLMAAKQTPTMAQTPLGQFHYDENNDIFWGVGTDINGQNGKLVSFANDGFGVYSVQTDHLALPDATGNNSGVITGIGSMLYFLNTTNTTVRAYDVSNPASPTLQGQTYTSNIQFEIMFSYYFSRNAFIYDAGGTLKIYLPGQSTNITVATLTED